MKIRLCKKEDIPEILKLGKDAFKHERWYSKKYLEKVLRENSKICWIMEDSGKLIGARFIYDDSDGRAWGWILAIEPDLRRKGIGSLLFYETAKRLKKQGFRKLYAECSVRNKPSITWHLKLGYKKAGIFRDWYGKGHHAVFFDYNL